MEPVAGWCPPGGCSVRVAEQAEQAATLAFQLGREHERAELAELESTWKPLARKTYEQKVAERVAEMERHAARLATELLERHGRVPWTYTGGPVDWETGRPLRRPEPYSSPENGTTLGVAERDVIGRWAA